MLRKNDLCPSYLSQKVKLIPSSVWKTIKVEFVEQNSQRPDISLLGIIFLFEKDFRRHIAHSTTKLFASMIVILIHVNAKSKVNEFYYSQIFITNYILELDISVGNRHTM